MSLIDYISEAVTPKRRVKGADQFWKRYNKSIMADKDISDLLGNIKDPAQKKKAIDTLSNIVNENYTKHGETYFKQGPNLTRYGALALSTIGAITAGGAIFVLAAGGPITFTALVSAGLANIALGGALGTAADIYDSKKSQQAIDGKLKPGKDYKGKLGYLRKIANKGWDVLTTPINPTTYKSLYKNMKQIGEGLAWRTISYAGGGFVAPLLGPYGQVATFGASAIDFYRGRKKFDDKVIQKIKDESIKQFKTQYGLESIVESEAQPSKSRNIIPLDSDYSHSVYPIMEHLANPNREKPLKYIEPRHKMAA